MKNFAKLVLFFSLCFTGILILTGLLDLLRDWTSRALLFPPVENGFLGNIAVYAVNALPAAFYLSILLGLSYAARRRMIYPAVFPILLILSLGLSAAAFLGVESLTRLEITLKASRRIENIAKPGFILSFEREKPVPDTQMVFLEDPYKDGAARVLSPQGQSLYYQREGTPFTALRLPFRDEKSGIFGDVAADLERSAGLFSAWFDAGLPVYGVYAGSLAVLLLSLGCLVNISFWSLANLFFGVLAFRGALALETFLNQGEIQRLLASFAGSFLPESLINPVIFAVLGALILLYSALVYLARGRAADG
ncbi:MAG: hypothetical protein LBD31_10685 [Treponema sp.]|nr:hypothetical protein [Treponema sp.]